MIKRLFQSLAGKEKTGFWLLNPNKISEYLFYLLLLFLPTQLGKHFWPDFSFVYGLRLDYISPTFYLTDGLIILIFVFCFPQVLKEISRKKIYLRAFILFLLFLLTGALFSKNPYAGVYGIIKLVEFSFLAFYAYKKIPGLNKAVIFTLLLTGIVFESLLSFLQYMVQGSIGGFFYFFGERTFNAQTPGIANASINGQLVLRPYATFSHPNVLAGYLVVSMLLLFLFLPKIKYAKIFLSAGVFLGTVSCLLTLSRTAIAVWIFYLLFIFTFSLVKKYKKRITNKTVFIFSILFLAIVFLTIIAFRKNFIVERFLETSLKGQSFVQRQELTGQALAMFYRHPVLGVGINNFYNNLSIENPVFDGELIQPVHNIFLLVLSESGLAGEIIFLYIFFRAFEAVYKCKKENRRYLLMALFAIVFLGMADHYFLTLQQGQILFTLCLGIAFSFKTSSA